MCGSDTASLALSVVHCSDAGVNTITADTETEIYPNPARDVLNIQITNQSPPLATEENVIIINMLGQTVYQGSMHQATTAQIDISHPAAGVYYIKVNGVVKKLMAE